MKRERIKSIKRSGNAESGVPVILVQAFIKVDTLSKCLDSLRACTGANDFRLVIFQDGVDGNPFMGKYEEEHQETKDFIKCWVETHEAAFQSIEFHPQTQGRGTTRTCKLSVDYVITGAPFVLFSEDDIIFEKDSLTYAQQIIETPDWTDPDVWAAALESKCFNSGDGIILPHDIEECRQLARDQELISKYTTSLEVMPSSCFVVTADKWAEWSETREREKLGSLQGRLREEGKTVLWPIVARARDDSMRHPKGYTMNLRKGVGMAEMVAQKNTFLTSGDLEADGAVALVRYEKSIDSLIDRTTRRFKVNPSQNKFRLHAAAFQDHTEVIAALLEAGADTTVRLKNGFTPLHVAAESNRIKVIAMLIAAGADHNTQNEAGETPLHIAARKGHAEVIAALLEAGADTTVRLKNGFTPLHVAAVSNRIKVSAALIAAGADANAQNGAGQTPLHMATFSGHTEVIAALLEAGTDHNTQNKMGLTPLHIAAKKGHTEVSAALIAAGADHNAQDRTGQTPLHIAAREGHTEVSAALITAGADANVQNGAGQTPLHIAAREGHTEVSAALIAAGADHNAQDRTGQTPLHIAIKKGHTKVSAALSAAGAEVKV